MDTGITDEVKPMNMEEFFERVAEGEMKPSDVPILALFILCALAVVIGEIGCVFWFFAILIFALCNGAAELLMLIPCLILFSMPEFQNPSAGFSFQQPHCVTMPFGPMLIRSSAVPQNTVIGIDKRFALETGQVGDVTTEYDKLIDRQFERTAITIISGFSKIYDEASRVISTSLQKKR